MNIETANGVPPGLTSLSGPGRGTPLQAGAASAVAAAGGAAMRRRNVISDGAPKRFGGPQ
jgi:hypothetical protein